jgi:hypothetical protein
MRVSVRNAFEGALGNIGCEKPSYVKREKGTV